MATDPACSDVWVDRLSGLFSDHPAWVKAARHLEPSASSTVYFSHRPGETWRLAKQGERAVLLSGGSSDPDFVFRFTPAAVDQLARTDGGIGDFSVTLFRLITEVDPKLHVGFRIVAPFPRLLRRGYLAVLAAGGMRVLAFGARRGVRTLAELKRIIEQSRSSEPADWEREARAPSDPGPVGSVSR